MKKVILFCLCFFYTIVGVHAESYCVLSSADNTVIEEKNMHEPQSVASISKIMTAIVALEQGNLEDKWQVQKEILQAVGSSIYLQVGQEVSLKSLLYGLMLRSGNDAAIAIATHISGSEEEFVKLMNAKAEEIGMLHTTFHNASGLDEDGIGNISTAYDMALLMSYAMRNETFREIAGAQYYTSEWNTRWQNKNKLLFQFPFTTGGKTGFTKLAGRTLVTSAKNNLTESIVVTLRQSDDFQFHQQKHKEVYETIKTVEVVKAGTYKVHQQEFVIEDPILVTVKQDGSDQINVYTHFKDGEFIVEVQKNEQVDVYSYKAKKASENVWKKVFS